MTAMLVSHPKLMCISLLTMCWPLLVASSQLKVIGAGLGRTGTDSLRLALNNWGFGPTYHMIEVLGVPGSTGDAYQRNHVAEWANIARSDIRNKDTAQYEDWDGFLGNVYNSGVDHPIRLFFSEILQRFPNAKVVYTTRSFGSWHRSIRQTYCRAFVEGGMDNWVDKLVYRFRGSRYFRLIMGDFEQRWRTMHAALDEREGRMLQLPGFSTGRVCRDKDYAENYYRVWDDYVRKTVPEHRLLVLAVEETDKASKLQKFLDISPSVFSASGYPHANNAKSFANGPILFNRLVAFISLLPIPLLVLAILLVKSRSRKPRPKRD